MFNTIHSQQNQIYNTAPTDFCIALHCREYTNYTLHTSSLSLIAPLLHQARLHLNLTAPSLRNTPLHLRVFYFFPFPYISFGTTRHLPSFDPIPRSLSNSHIYIYLLYLHILQHSASLFAYAHDYRVIASPNLYTTLVPLCHAILPPQIIYTMLSREETSKHAGYFINYFPYICALCDR